MVGHRFARGEQGTHTPSSVSITVAEGMELWIAASDGLEYSTIKQRREHKRLHIDPCIGSLKLASLTTPRVYALDRQLRDNGCSLAMRRKVLTSVKMMLTHCQRTGRVAQNVALAVRIKADDKRDHAPLRAGVDFPSREELRTILDKAEGRWRPRVITAIFTGMRASELRGLPWENVDLDAGVIHVRQRADLWGNIGKPKSKAGNRDIPLAPMAVNALRQHRQSSGLNLVFPDDQGNVESHDDLLTWFKQLQIANGMTREDKAKYGLHALRHAAASLFIAHLGWTAKRVQSVLGHSSIQMTFDLYGHLFEDHEGDREAMRRLEDAITG